MKIGTASHRTRSENSRGVNNQLSTSGSTKTKEVAVTRNGVARQYAGDLDVNIERLRLDGFGTIDRHHVATAIENELARLLSNGVTSQLLTANAEIPRLRSTTIEIAPNAKAVWVGRTIAREIYRGLSQ